MTLQETLIDIMQLDSDRFRIKADKNKKDVEMMITSENGESSYLFANIYEGNKACIEKDSDNELYQRIVNASNKDMYNRLMQTYEENMTFFKRYEDKIKNNRNVNISLKDPEFFYNKRSKKLYIMPVIQVRTASALYYFNFSIKDLSNIEKTVDQLFERFYYDIFQFFITKPLNQYTKEELELFHMIKY